MRMLPGTEALCGGCRPEREPCSGCASTTGRRIARQSRPSGVRDGAVRGEHPKKGFMFTIDATLALFLMVLFLATALFLSSQGETDPFGKLQVMRLGNDALIVLDRQGTLLTGNRTLIGNTLNSTLPDSIGAHLEISTYYYDSGQFNLINITKYGEEIPNGTATYGSRLDFVSLRNGLVTNYSSARMVVWQK